MALSWSPLGSRTTADSPECAMILMAGMETDRVFLEPVDPNTMVWESPVSKYTLPSNTPSGNPPADIGSLKSRGALSNPLRNSSFEDHLAESS